MNEVLTLAPSVSTENLENIRQSARAFAETHIRPYVMEWDESQEFPIKMMNKMGEYGFLGVLVPEEYGGAGLEYQAYITIIEEIAKGLLATSQRGFGALVVIERDILVDYQIEVGTELDAKVSSELIQSVFHPASPVHDGALIIRNGKIHSAGSFLPLSKNPALDKNLGTT